MDITLRGKVYKISNATDYHVTMITSAMDGEVRRPKQDSDIAYVIKSCCPQLAADGLVSYRHLTHADDSEETEFKQGLNADEVAVFVAGLSLQMIADRVERLKALDLSDDRLIETRSRLVKQTEEALASADANIEKLKVTVLLGSVEIAETPTSPTQNLAKINPVSQDFAARQLELLKELKMVEKQLAVS